MSQMYIVRYNNLLEKNKADNFEELEKKTLMKQQQLVQYLKETDSKLNDMKKLISVQESTAKKPPLALQTSPFTGTSKKVLASPLSINQKENTTPNNNAASLAKPMPKSQLKKLTEEQVLQMANSALLQQASELYKQLEFDKTMIIQRCYRRFIAKKHAIKRRY